MAAFNEVAYAVTTACPACGAVAERSVQYSFGDTWQYRYRIGDRITWGGNDVGEPGLAAVVADGYGTACLSCGADEWSDMRYEVHFAHDVIVAVEPASGKYDFEKSHVPYLVLDASKEGRLEPLAVSRDTIREYWATYRDRADIERVAAKSSPSVVLDLIELYRTLSSEQRNDIDALLAEQLNSDDATIRFDSMAVIQEFKIRSAVPGLVELTVRLEGQAGPQARNELAKTRALIDELD